MKRWSLCLCLYACLCLLTACGASPGGDGGTAAGLSSVDGPDTAGPPSLETDETPTVLLCRIVDGAEEGNLLLAELDEGLYGGAGVYQLPVGDLPVTLDGQPADASVLEDGMPVEVSFSGLVLESFPAQLGEVYAIAAWSQGQAQNPMGTCYDLCGLYLQALDDLWQKDPALNEDITLAAVDLTQAPGGLTEGEKAALIWRFGQLHQVEAFAAAFADLEEQGYLTSVEICYTDGGPESRGEAAGPAFYEWKDGCLFTIRANEGHEGEVYSLPVVFFDVKKWRSSLGAYCLYDCSAGWAQTGSWNGYTVGSEMIS